MTQALPGEENGRRSTARFAQGLVRCVRVETAPDPRTGSTVLEMDPLDRMPRQHHASIVKNLRLHRGILEAWAVHVDLDDEDDA